MEGTTEPQDTAGHLISAEGKAPSSYLADSLEKQESEGVISSSECVRGLKFPEEISHAVTPSVK